MKAIKVQDFSISDLYTLNINRHTLIFEEIYWSATGGWILSVKKFEVSKFLFSFFCFFPLNNSFIDSLRVSPQFHSPPGPLYSPHPCHGPPMQGNKSKRVNKRKRKKNPKTNKQAEKQTKRTTKTKQNSQQHKSLFASSFLLLQNLFILPGAMETFVCHNSPPINFNTYQLKNSATYIYFAKKFLFVALV